MSPSGVTHLAGERGRVLVTGAAGFKGRWLMDLLAATGRSVVGWDKVEPVHAGDHEWRLTDLTEPFEIPSDVGTVFHLAAQALVPLGYRAPRSTWIDNIVPTVNLMEAARTRGGQIAIVVVTSDKVYRLPEEPRPLIESDELGGYCPYSASKAAVELVVESYRGLLLKDSHVVTVRAGNVIGGGDTSRDRLVPDVLRAAAAREPVVLRQPHSTRPWLFVLDCLWGYILAADSLSSGEDIGASLNFGPHGTDQSTALEIATMLSDQLGSPPPQVGQQPDFNEAPYIYLDSGRARSSLGWSPKVTVNEALDWIAEWARADGPVRSNKVVRDQIARYLARVEMERA